MPIPQTFNAFLGAAVLGVVSAAGMFIFEHIRHERRRRAMVRDLARIDQELSLLKRDLQQLLISRQERPKISRKTKSINKANSVISTNTSGTNYYSNSSDLEFYDLSDGEGDVEIETNLDKLLDQIDRKMDEGCLPELENCLEKLRDLCISNPENSELLWRIGKTHHKIGEKIDDKDATLEHINNGIEACNTAIKLDSSNAESHKWLAILIGSRSNYQPLKDKLSDGHKFKDLVDKAVSLNPNDASLHYLMGRFDFEVAGLKWYERKVAAAIFSEPPKATYEEALQHFLDAQRLSKLENWKENSLMIAKCKIAMSEYKEAVNWLEKANSSNYQDDTLDNEVDSEVKVLLEQYNSYR